MYDFSVQLFQNEEEYYLQKDMYESADKSIVAAEIVRLIFIPNLNEPHQFGFAIITRPTFELKLWVGQNFRFCQSINPSEFLSNP